MSYQKEGELVLERSGTSSLSDQRIYQIAESKAQELVLEQGKRMLDNEKWWTHDMNNQTSATVGNQLTVRSNLD